MKLTNQEEYAASIAVIGKSGRFPGAGNLVRFWRNLCAGTESIAFFTEDELLEEGVDPALLLQPNYVRALGFLENADLFDAQFFGFTPHEAQLIDPQHRVFLECAWEALENAGYASDEPGMIGVFASSSLSRYMRNLWFNPAILGVSDPLQILTGNDKDHVAMRVSYKLNLKGPSICVQSACSSSLVAVHMACRSLLTYECDVALAGGVSIGVPFKDGYLYQEGGIASPDGHCRAFDANAKGTVLGYGAGIVVLKRLFEAIKDGDSIQAVIRGSAINNDGSNKIGYTAPSVESQADVVRSALAVARVPSDTISYVEAHGTGTPLGDPIELTALSKAFRSGTGRKTRCAIGALKTNIGHLDAAAGVAGLIKTVLALENKALPPSLNFETPNPKADFETSPFFVNTALTEWNSEGTPRRAGVSSLGMGGTNVHVVLEEAPDVDTKLSDRKHQLLVLSARTQAALEATTANLTDHLQNNPHLRLCDIAHTLQVGRKAFSYRSATVCETISDAIQHLSSGEGLINSHSDKRDRPVVFMFPGQGAQYPGMGAGLYRTERVFREHADQCIELLRKRTGTDLKPILYPERPFTDADALQFAQTSLTQLALFITEYAMAKLWMHWGITPEAMIGHSIGEYVAACLSGVVSLEDALAIVARRGTLMQATKPGTMLAVSCSAAQVEPFLDGSISVAAINTPSSCVVAGDTAKISALEEALAKENISCQRLVTSHAFHSGMMDPIVGQFQREIAKTKLGAPKIPYISNLTGRWATPEVAGDPESWARHLRSTVRFADGITTLMSSSERVYLEVGPGRTLSSFVKQSSQDKSAVFALSPLNRNQPYEQEGQQLLEALGKLWTAGVRVDWSRQYGKAEARRIPLPTYPFERQRYFVESDRSAGWGFGKSKRSRNFSERYYVPSWKQLVNGSYLGHSPGRKTTWVAFVNNSPLAESFATKQRESGNSVILVHSSPGNNLERLDDQGFRLDPMNPAHYQKLISAVGDLQACEFVNFWSLSGSSPETEHIAVEHAFYSLLFLAQVIGERNSIEKTNIWVISNGLAQLGRGESLSRDKAILLGPCRTIPLEYENVRCCLVDVGFSELDVETLVSVCREAPLSTFVACRLGQPWVQCFEPVALPPVSNKVLHIRDGGVYLITGGLGGIGLTLGKWLAREAGAKLVLLGRSLPPPRAEWDELGRNESTPAPIRYQINVLRELEEAGNTPLVCNADVGAESEVRGAVEQAMAQFGAIHGIIHAAGVAGGGLIQFKTTSAIQAVLRPKIEGTLILERIFQDFDLDFFVACSSVASVQGAFGQIDYCAANAFLDAFCLSNRLKPSTPTYSIGWDAWKEVGMARNASLSANLERFRLQRLSTALSTKDGIEAFARILSVEKPRLHVLVSNEDLTLLPQQDSSDSETQHHLPVSAPTHPRPELKGDLVLPRNEAEQSIAEVWQAVLGIQGIGVNDDFWELGGHSLLATQVVSRLKERFHVPLPLRALFEMPTVAKLAEEMARLQDSQASPGASGEQDFELPSIQRADRNGKLVLSYGQERLWFIYQLEPENIAYNIHTAVRIKGPLHLDSLERTLREVVQRHESLRTRFVNLDGELQQVIESSMVVELPVTDLSHLGEGEREAEARKAAIHEARQPFDLERGPLFRAKLLRLAGENHVLVFNMHHIVSDQWSIGILVREVSLIYNSFSTGQPSPLPELDIQYADFSAWQRRWLHGEVLDQQLNYWKKQLAAASVLELPTDRPRNLSQIQKGEVIEFNVSVELLAQLKQLCLQQSTTLYMCLLAAFQLLLYRWSGQDDVTVGAPIAGRRRTETETLIGFFLNTLVLRTDLSGSPTFLQLLRRVREVTLGAYAHQDVPFEKLVEELSPERDLHRPPFFQVIFFMQNVPMTDLYLGEKTTVELFASDTAAAKLDITVVFEERASGTVGSVLYNADLYDAQTIAQMVEQYQALLTAIAAHPEEIIDSCPLVPESAYQGYVKKWNQPLGSEERALAAHAISHGSINSSVSPNSKAISGITKRPLFVHEMFQQIAEQHPDFIAVDSADGDLTYSQLNQRSNQIAARLRDMGVRKNESVVVCAESRKFMIESVLGILKAGAAFVPLSPGVPAARLKGLVDQCNPKWALVAPDAAERFNALAVHSVQVVSADSVADAASYKPGEESHGDDFSYIFFTSGSTGKPKAIAGRLKALDQFMRWEISTFAMGPGTRVSQLMSPMFDAFMRDVFAPLCSGGTVCIPPSQEVLLDGRQLGNWIREKRIALIHTVPTLFRTLINQSTEDGGWPDLRYMLLSGEPLLPADVKKWHDIAGSGPRLVNLYGASEVTMCKFMYLVNEADHLRRLIPVGKPFPDSTAVAIDNAGKICAPGTIGELYIRTPFRALGYYNEPELTAKVFVQNPFSQEDGDIVYKTGDLARPRADGSFELVGRRDHQVKIRGVRIELGEVEKAVNECPGVAEAVVTAREVSPGENRLVGYFVPGKGLQLSASALIASLRQRLPDYMIPTAWVMLEKMPLSPNGKIDRKNLPEPDADVPQHDYVAPRNPTEETLCTLWQEILRHKGVGIHDNFFTIGGHSLLAAQVATRLRESFKVEIPLRRIFELPTVAQLAEEISQVLKAAGTNGAQSHVLPSIKRVQRKAALLPVERD